VGESDLLRVGDEILSVEQIEERERLAAEDPEAERWADSADGAEDLRSRDLEPVGLDNARQASVPLTEQQRRSQAAWGEIPRGPRSPYIDIDDGTIVELWHGEDAEHEGEALSLRGGDKHFKEDRPTQAAIKRSEDWRKANDPHLALAGVGEEIDKALEAVYTSLEDVRRLAFPNGRPNAVARELRAKVRVALMQTYEDKRTRVLMAESLGCSTTALWSLMAPREKP
jgi:hypothetical protein